jgi:hypothetical protein
MKKYKDDYKRIWPAGYAFFFEEYKQLCMKHGLMVLSDGEKVTIGGYDKDLWGIKNSTKEERKHFRRWYT